MKDRKALNELILKEKRNIDEENFDEAIAASYRACRKTEIPRDIQQILKDEKAQQLTKDVFPEKIRSNFSQRVSGYWQNVLLILLLILLEGMERFL
jgi:hypothetical protein